ncbi:spore germination protein [Cohnella sp. GCM10012308]|uniref:spore germination protein n=1 Tax=Cohnella sp. GCM10012308 TaxID=3317329 RepID=UPI00361E15DB
MARMGSETAVARELRVNREKACALFDRCQDVNIIPLGDGQSEDAVALIVYCASLMDEQESRRIRTLLAEPLLRELSGGPAAAPDCESRLREAGARHQAELFEDWKEIEDKVWQGYLFLVAEGWTHAAGFKSAGLTKRQVTEPVSEPSVQGPREGTVETLAVNLGMLRQRVGTSRLKIEYLTAGKVLRTNIAFAYVDDTVDAGMLAEFRERIGRIAPYEVLDTSFVEDAIQDSQWSPFPQHRYTERTDTAAASLLDGKILVLTDNSPMILICPAFFVDFFTTSEDYYVRTVYASTIRLLRLLAFAIALTLPSAYVAMSTFHPELIPNILLLAILDAREGIPFPAIVEALIMETSFELLREAGIRLPRPVGSAVSIVGALVIGQAAIMAKIASPIMVIVVALTGIASFAIPHYEMAIAIRLLRFPLILAASFMGGYGLMLGFILILLHLCCLQTLRQPYLSSFAPLKLRDLRDVIVRAPLKALMRSPRNRRLHAGAPGKDGKR